jgi:hypothetical protein
MGSKNGDIWNKNERMGGELKGGELFTKPMVKLHFIYFSAAICDFRSVFIPKKNAI